MQPPKSELVPKEPQDPLSFLDENEKQEWTPQGTTTQLIKGVGMEVANMLGAAALDAIPFGKALGFLIKAQGIYRAARERALSKINEFRLADYVVTGMRVARGIEDNTYEVTGAMKPDIAKLTRRAKPIADVADDQQVQSDADREIQALETAADAFAELELQMSKAEESIETAASPSEAEEKAKQALALLKAKSEVHLRGSVSPEATAIVATSVAQKAVALLERPDTLADLPADVRERITKFNEHFKKQCDTFRYSAQNIWEIFHKAILHWLPESLKKKVRTETFIGPRNYTHVDNAVIDLGNGKRIEISKWIFNDFDAWFSGDTKVITPRENSGADSAENRLTFHADKFVVHVAQNGSWYPHDLFDNTPETLAFSDNLRDIVLLVAESCARMDRDCTSDGLREDAMRYI